MKLYRLRQRVVAEEAGSFYEIPAASWDELVAREDLKGHLGQLMQGARAVNDSSLKDVLAPIGSQEVWAAGVTYYRSRNARMEESKSAGGGDFYDRVYHAERPELFFKATPHRVVGPGGKVAIREDARWSVPEPELALFISPGGKIVGYTVGNDMSSRDIEGENPLYLPQAKVYDRSCALGPCLLVAEEPLAPTTEIKIEIRRSADTVFSGATTLPKRMFSPNRHRDRASRFLYAQIWRRNSNYDSSDWYFDERRRMMCGAVQLRGTLRSTKEFGLVCLSLRRCFFALLKSSDPRTAV
jgi:2-dehydro-3-deoxy-D-arabinonate dehydratase